MDSQKVSYYNEISLMMFGFGDSHTPNPETVHLIESIVLKQLRTIVQEALKYSDGVGLEGEELVFLMRHNKFKMRRFVRYLQLKEMKKKMDTILDATKVRHKLLDFIQKIDETGELCDTNEFDECKYERQVRADRISLALDEKKYLQFAKARCSSFSRFSQAHNFDKLRLWIDPKKKIDMNLTALDVLSYFAYETVAELIDYALLVRLDNKRTTDPLNNLSGMFYTASMFNNENKFESDEPDYSRVYSGQAPISPNEIKEVMRRIHSPQAGCLLFGKKFPETHYLLAL